MLATGRSEAHERVDQQVALGTLEGILSLYFEGDLDAAFAFGGQVAGRIDTVESVDDIIRETMTEFHEVVAQLARRYPAHR